MDNNTSLEKIIYDIQKESSFFIRAKVWSVPVFGFSYDNSMNAKSLEVVTKSGIINEAHSNIICILGDWESAAEGIFFTDTCIYVNSPKNASKKFSVEYSDIKRIKYSDSKLAIFTTAGDVSYITTPIWNKRNIKIFLQIASGIYEFDEADERIVKSITLPSPSSVGADTAATVFGNVSNASTMYGQDKFSTPRGHGFAAERANHMFDKLTGKDARLVGDDNAKNGADRIVNGTEIQSKYCNSGSKCVSECFDNNGFRYWNRDGKPMQIEVPSDKYDAAVKAMESRIERGEVKGINDPAEAKNIVRKGNFTYEQARNIARAGTVESITFDAVNGAVVATYAFGLSTALSFAVSIWNGEDFEKSLKVATYSGLRVGGITFVSSVLASQISKAGLNSALVGSSEAIVNIIGSKASAVLVNAFRSGANIYGAAAMKSAAKLLRGNAITGAVTIVVLSSFDVVNIFRGRISGKQLFKNVTTTAGTVVGGTAGWVGGAAAGATLGSAVPIIGTAIGGVVGGIIGSFAAGAASSKVTGAVLGTFIEDDADEMVKIIEKEFLVLVEEFLLNQNEAESVVDGLRDALNGNTLKDMFSSTDREAFARSLLVDRVEAEIIKRKPISLPTHLDMTNGLRVVLEEISDNIEPSMA